MKRRGTWADLGRVVRGLLGPAESLDLRGRQFAPDTRSGDLFGGNRVTPSCRTCLRREHWHSDCDRGTCGLTGHAVVAAHFCKEFVSHEWHD